MVTRFLQRLICLSITFGLLACCCTPNLIASEKEGSCCCAPTSGCEAVDTSCSTDHETQDAISVLQKDILVSGSSSSHTLQLTPSHAYARAYYIYNPTSSWLDMMGSIRLQC